MGKEKRRLEVIGIKTNYLQSPFAVRPKEIYLRLCGVECDFEVGIIHTFIKGDLTSQDTHFDGVVKNRAPIGALAYQYLSQSY